MTMGPARDAGSPPAYLPSADIYESSSSNTLNLSDAGVIASDYSGLLNESISGSSLCSNDYDYPAKGIPPYPETSIRLDLRRLSPLAHNILGSPKLQSDDPPVLVTSPRPSYIKTIPKLSEIDHVELWTNAMTPQAPPGLERTVDPKEEEDWIPEGSLYNPKALWSKLRQGRARLSVSSQPVWSRSPTPSTSLDSTSAARSSLQPPSRSAYRSASYDDLQRFREVLERDPTIVDAPESRPRRWSLSSPGRANFASRSHKTKNPSISISDGQTSSHGTDDYSMQNIPKIKLSTSDNTLAISIPSSAPSSGSGRPDSDRAEVMADLTSFSLAARRGRTVPKPLALNQVVDDVAPEAYPDLPTAFMFSPTTGTSDANRFSTTDLILSQVSTGMDTSDMIKQLQAVASELKPTTPVDVVHYVSTNPIISVDSAESQSDDSSASVSSHNSFDGLDTSRASRALSIASEDEWAFARDLMESNGDPLPPKSPKKDEVVPPVPVIPAELKVSTPAASSSLPVSASGSASKLLKPVVRTGIPKALVPGTTSGPGTEPSARTSSDKPTGIQLPSRRVVSPISTAATDKSTGIQLPSRRVASPTQIASTNPAEASLDSTPRSSAPAPKKDTVSRKPVPHHLPTRASNASSTVRSLTSGVPASRRSSGATPTSMKTPSPAVSSTVVTVKATRPISRITSPEPVHTKATIVPAPRRQAGATPTSSKGSSRPIVASGAVAKSAARTSSTSVAQTTPAAPRRVTPPARKETPKPTVATPVNPPAAEGITSFAPISALTARPPTPPLARTINASISDSVGMSILTPSTEDLAGSLRPLRGILKQRKKVWWDDDPNNVPSLVAVETPSPERTDSTPGPETPSSPLSLRRNRAQSVMLLAASVGSPTVSEDARRRSFAGAPSKSDSALDTTSERRTRRAFSFSRSSAGDKEAADKENKSRFSLLGGGAGASSKRASQVSADGGKKSSILSLFGKLRV
ncbi:unnamed protein product [Peniophora sp. CBMAI 1063]|nr:unnamed protein product [Peniophora sp. CBMAI 1063]